MKYLMFLLPVFSLGLYARYSVPTPVENLDPRQTFNLAESIKRGKEFYTSECQNCHMENGEGLTGVYPPLAKADYLKKPSAHLISVVLDGLEGEIKVNGVTYNSPMPPQAYIEDEKVADILNYIRNSWGNKGAAITPAEVKTQRAKKK